MSYRNNPIQASHDTCNELHPHCSRLGIHLPCNPYPLHTALHTGSVVFPWWSNLIIFFLCCLDLMTVLLNLQRIAPTPAVSTPTNPPTRSTICTNFLKDSALMRHGWTSSYNFGSMWLEPTSELALPTKFNTKHAAYSILNFSGSLPDLCWSSLDWMQTIPWDLSKPHRYLPACDRQQS